MSTIRRIPTSQIDGNNADTNNENEIRPYGEIGLYEGNNNKLELLISDGQRTHFNSKVLAKGTFYGGDADSADGNNYDTIKLIPDVGLVQDIGTDQYVIIDPTAPDHVHIRAGGTIDNSSAELILGGENSYVKIGAGSNPQITVESNSNSWIFGTDGALTVPGVVQNDNSFEIKAGNATNTVEFLGQIDNGFGDGPGATLHITSIINGTITDGMTIYGAGLPVEGWVLQFGTVMAPQGNGGTGNYYLPGANYLTGSQSFNNGDAINSTWTFGTDSHLNIPGNIILSNSSTLATGTFDNGTGGSNGISLNCAVGYELNWQGGHLKNTSDGGLTVSNILADSAIEFPGSGIDNMEINSGGLIFPDGTTQNTAAAGGVSIEEIQDNLGNSFLVAGTGISLSYNDESDTLTINSTGTSVEQVASLVTTVFNKTGSPIPKFSVVYISGGQGDQPTIALASASGETTSSKTYGITAEAIGNMSTGKVIVYGALTGVNTDQFNPTAPTGDVNGVTLYLSPTTPGGVTTTKPSAPNHMVAVGTIIRTHQNEGVVEVRVQNGYELEELHNVAVGGVTNGQFLQYNSSTKLWVPSSSGTFTILDVDNLRLDGNTLSSTNSNGNIIINPSGTGALQRDGGGDARGTYAIDWQSQRFNNNQVASGMNSVIGGGSFNRAAGQGNVIGGGNGNFTNGLESVISGGTTNQVTGDYSAVCGGDRNAASGDYSFIAGGSLNSDGGYNNVFILGSNITAVIANATYVENLRSSGYVIGSSAKFDQLYPTVVNKGTVSGSVTTNVNDGQIFDIIVNGATTLSNPTNAIDGVTVRWRITQGGIGNHSILLDTQFQIPSSMGGSLSWSTTAGATDILVATYHSFRGKWDIVSFTAGH